MDKRRLFEDIATIRKRIFALSASTGFTVVFVASIWGKGFDFLTIFINSSIGLIVFGALGFAIGILYERLIEEPLVESYRIEAAERLGSLTQANLELDVAVSELQPGMKVCNQVISSEGATLVRPGTVLTDRLIAMLQEKGIDSVRVRAQRAYANR